VDANLALEEGISTLLLFVPVLKNGGTAATVIQARNLLLADENLAELEPLLAFLSTFILESEIVRQIMRWDMAVIRESPWAKEFFQEGVQEGRRTAAVEMLLQVLNYRLGAVPPRIAEEVSTLTNVQLSQLLVIALETDSWAKIEHFLEDPPTPAIPSSSN
jgi:hypothetical protein